MSRSRPLTALAIGAGAIVVVLVAAQVVLPALAERRLASDLERFGSRPDVQVSAFPAIKLLFGSADRVEVHIASARTVNAGPVADQLARSTDADEIDVRVDRLQVGPLTMRDARVTKRAKVLTGAATVREADLRAALPAFVDLRPAARQDGDGLLLDGSVSVLGARIGARARVSAQDGALRVAPEGIPFGALATLTVFSDPRVRVVSLGSAVRPGGFELTARARLTG